MALTRILCAAVMALGVAQAGAASEEPMSLEHGYRFLRRTTGLKTQALLSRQAVAVLGIDQDFSNHKMRETLGWEPRIDYATGLAKTVAWLQNDYLAG